MRFFKKCPKVIIAFIFILAIALVYPTAFASAEERELYVGGFTAGFILNTQEVEVIGTCDVVTEDGAVCPARQAKIKCGDKIVSVNGILIDSTKRLTELMEEKFATYKINILRDNEPIELEMKAAIDKKTGKRRLGLLVKDSLNGIGTVTYVDGNAKKFASLGHPVTNEQGEELKINGGKIYACQIYDVKRGVRGTPGELKGIFDNSSLFGTVKINCKCGIFGDVDEKFEYKKLQKAKAGSADEAKMGKAKIYSTVDGKSTQCYDVSIVKVDPDNRDNRNYVIKVDDERLLKKTGGIVQGMSGSPIVQNGKIIGAVTHVFVNDPTRGYGISLDKMTSSY